MSVIYGYQIMDGRSPWLWQVVVDPTSSRKSGSPWHSSAVLARAPARINGVVVTWVVAKR